MTVSRFVKGLSPHHRWFGAAVVLWLLVLAFTPAIIRAAYLGQLGVFNRLITGQDVHSVQFYQNAWRQLALLLTVILIAAWAVFTLIDKFNAQIRSLATRIFGQLTGVRNRDIITLGLWFGLIVGVAEALRWIIEHFGLHRVTERIALWDLLWQIPLSAMVWLALVGLGFIALSALLRSVAPAIRPLAPLVMALVGIYGFLEVLPFGIHAIAKVILALGLATSVVRVLSQRLDPTLRVARRSLLVALPLLLLWAGTLTIGRRNDLNSSFAGHSPARAGAPNIIFIIWDTVRAASLSLYGYDRSTTPNLDKLASQAVVFERAITPASWTLPAHASMFTGLYHHQHKADYNSPLEPSATTIAEFLRVQGYHTVGFVANTYWAGGRFGLNQGFDWYADRPPLSARALMLAWSPARTLDGLLTRAGWPSTDRITAAHLHTSFFHWLDKKPANRPFFALFNEFDAHEPYIPPPPFEFRFSAERPVAHWSRWEDAPRTPKQLRQLREAYDACIYYLDAQLEQLRAELERRGLLENTLIILTADHGENLGEQDPRLLGHFTNVYMNVLNVPLVFYWPAQLSSGIRVKEPVSLIDLPATIADIAQGGDRAGFRFPGHSLVPLLQGSNAAALPRSPALSQTNPADFHKTTVWPIAKGPLHSLIQTEGLHYIKNARAEESLFDVTRDPWELKNIANTPHGRAAVPEYRGIVSKLLAEQAAAPERSVAHRY